MRDENEKRMLSMLLILAMLLPMLPRLAIGAEAAETDELRQAITEQYDAYAASIKQPNADEEAIKQLLNHSIDHPGKLLAMDESDPLTASLFQSNMFREFMITALTYSAETMQSEHEQRIMIGTSSLAWHDFALQYRVSRLLYSESLEKIDNADVLDRPVPLAEYKGPWNEHDKAMALIVGGCTVRMWLNTVSTGADQITYKVRLRISDEFEFSGTYEDATLEGYDVSTSLLINMVGKLFLNEYEWYTETDFEIAVPNYCTHESASYSWEFNGTDLVDAAGEGFSGNPLTRIQTEKTDGTLSTPYYETGETVCLWHDLPWVVEYRIKGSKVFVMSPHAKNSVGMSYLLKSYDHVFGGEFYQHQMVNPETGKEQTRLDRKQYGIDLQDHNCNGRHLHTYRLENRIAEDGSNMVWLSVDGVEFGPMDNFFLNISSANYDQEQKVDWFNGRDIQINFIFNSVWGFTEDTEIEYVRIWENGEGAEPYSYYETTTAAPTCTEPGKIVHTCSLCGASHYEVTEAALGHTPEAVPGVAASCEADGLTDGSKCTVCGEIVTEQTVIPALGHAWDEGAVVTGAACTQAGEMLYTCANDPSHTRTEAIAMLPHNTVTDAAVEVTCSGNGLTEGSHCADCGTVLTAQEVIPALGHSWGEGKLTVRPSEEGSGVIAYSCAACGEIREEEVPYQPPVRIAGANRFETAFLAADAMKTELGVEKFENIIVASGTNFADALSGSYLASVKNAPILLSNTSDAINDRVKDYIRANLNPGGTVYILGGETAVPASMEEGLDGFSLRRLAGRDRFATNLAILSEAGVEGKDLLVCTGLDFADSLSASAAELPILLVWDELTEAQKFFLDSAGIGDMYIIGGENAVRDALEAHLTLYGDVRRIGGANRFETSVNIARKFFNNPDSAVLAYAWNYPDGLCGGALAATMDAPLILTMANYESAAATYVYENAIQTGTILGGESLIPDEGVRLIFGLDADTRITRK